MSFIAASVAMGGSAILGYLGSQKAAGQQAQAANNATAAQANMFNTVNQQNAPWRAAGQGALSTIGSMLSGTTTPTNPSGINLNSTFNNQDLNANLAPNYQFMLGQGQSATNNLNNATGGMIGGNALQGLDTFTQNYAGNAYQNAFNNYQAQNNNIFSRLSNIAGLGSTANQTTGQAAGTFGTGMSNTIMGLGAAQASGTVGGTNALTGGLNNLGGMAYLNSMTPAANSSAALPFSGNAQWT